MTTEKKAKTRRFTLDLPVEFYFRISRIREDFYIKEGKNIGIKEVFKLGLNSLSREFGYKEIEKE